MDSFDKQIEMVLYHSAEGDVSVDAYIIDESLWITQKSMAKLFGIDKSGIRKEVSKLNDGATLKIDNPPDNQTYYEVNGEKFIQLYARILIKKKGTK